MAQATSSQRFFSQTDKHTFADLPPARHIQPQLKFGVSEDLPDILKTRYSLVRKDFQPSPDRKQLKPSFHFNEFAFYGDKEIYDFSSAKPTSTFDMLNIYRLDLKMKSPFFKEYKRVLANEGFAKARGMCATITELNSIGRAPNHHSLKQNKKYSSLPPLSPTISNHRNLPSLSSPPLLAKYANKHERRPKRRKMQRASCDLEDMRTSIDKFEELLKHGKMEEVQAQYFAKNFRY